MWRRIFALFRNLIIGIIWSYVFLVSVNFVFYALWNFNLFYARSWETIAAFWQAGGIIKTGKDYIFLAALAAVPVVWAWGWRRLCRADYLAILLSPLNAYNNYVIRKYGHSSSRIVLKSLKSSQKQIETIKQQLESIKPEKPQEVNHIREQIHKKLESSQK